MKKVLVLMMMVLAVGQVVAQPKKSRVPQSEQQKKKNPSSAMSMRAQISFPTALEMPEEVVWRRDIYRELDLMQDANAGLYYPVEPQGRQVNLFTYIFKLAQNGYIPVYEYPTDGSDVLTDETKVQMKTILDNYHIFYEEQDGKLKVDNSDIPSAEVKKFYLKECAYYDQANSSFHIKVLALCPVMLRDDDFGGEATQYPLFWVKYSDVEPFLNRQTVMASNLNNAATVSMDDYFTLNMYRGTIYKTTQKKIYGDPAKKDSLDSIAKLDVKHVKSTKSSSRSSRRTKAGKSNNYSSSKSSASGSARVTVRRQRH